MSGTISYFQFDHHFVSTNKKFLQDLSSAYCNLWRFDPNFAEYKKCPKCDRYFSYDFVVNQGNTICPDCSIKEGKEIFLVEAWVEEEMENKILELTSLGEDFFGAVAYDNLKQKVVGFVWGVNRSFHEMVSKKEPENIIATVYNHTGKTPYFNEIATDPAYREHGIGSELCFMLVEWMKKKFVNIPGYLHTHKDSPARRLFERSGYVFHSNDERLGGGRIYMFIDNCAFFTPENLRR